MKTTITRITSLLLVLVCLTCLFSCGKEEKATGVWTNALYTENSELGSGEKTVIVEVKAEDKTVTFTIKTDADTVGSALIEHNLIAGENSEYGLYIKTVNGMLADYDVDQTYWAFYINGEYAMTGVDSTEITADTIYTLERTK